MDVPEVLPDAAVELRARGAAWIDVREQFEWDEARIPDTTHVPLQQSADWVLRELPDRSSPLVVSCLSGARSGNLVAWLCDQGYTDVHNLRGGLQLWSMQGRALERGPSA
jgi:rhodanese-related sulfurtransferase